jgi:ADP-ribose pyrophosphatase YjhB (NUDIX family)
MDGAEAKSDAGYCRMCGGRLALRALADDHRRRHVCRACGFIDFRKPNVAAGVIIVRDGRVLLTRRGADPYSGLWCLPAGFVEADEGTADGAVREAREETGLEVVIEGVFGVYDYTDDPRGRGTLVLYAARVTGGREMAGDDATELRWQPVAALEHPWLEAEVAFEQHRAALRALRSGGVAVKRDGGCGEGSLPGSGA